MNPAAMPQHKWNLCRQAQFYGNRIIFVETHFNCGEWSRRMICENDLCSRNRNAMRETVHLSLASHDEVMYRDEADLIRGFNCLAVAVLETESRLMAEGFLSTHHHSMVQTDNAKALVRKERYAYTRYFNARYGRRGSLGEKAPFFLSIDGLYHTMVALNYVLRQGLHHGLSETPFGYVHGSANAFFRHQLGKPSPEKLMPADQRSKYLPDRACVPDSIRMLPSGLLAREDVIDTAYVEKIYITPRNFLFQMNKLSDEKWLEEQKGEQSRSPVITLDLIETGVKGIDVAQLLRNENGKVNTGKLTDLELCRIIDKEYLPRMIRRRGLGQGQEISVYQLSATERSDLGNSLWQEIPRHYKKRTSVPQLRRCLCMDY